jgi:hypothetical protein
MDWISVESKHRSGCSYPLGVAINPATSRNHCGAFYRSSTQRWVGFSLVPCLLTRPVLAMAIRWPFMGHRPDRSQPPPLWTLIPTFGR